MTTTPLNYFDKVPGTLEQLVLGIITQKLINRDYVPELLRTDFTSNSVAYSITSDSRNDGTNNTNLAISITFPTVPYARQILVDKEGFDERVMSINSLNVDTLSLPQKPSYPIKSFPAQLPDYLSQLVPDNILERRLMALCLHIRNYQNWVHRWNTCVSQWQLAKYQQVLTGNPNVQYVIYSTIPLAEIERLRDDLILELTTKIGYPRELYFDIITSLSATPVITGDPSSAQELVDFLGGIDPGNEDRSPLSSQLLENLFDAATPNVPGSEPQINTPDEKPTLPNC